MRKQHLLEDTAGTVYYDIPQGRPSAYTVTIKDRDNANLPNAAVSGATATLDAVNTTVTAWSADTPAQVTLTAITNIARNRTYLLTNAIGETAMLKVKGIDSSGKIVYFYEDCPITLAASDAFQGTRISYVVTALNAAESKLNYRCQWMYTVSSVAYQVQQSFDIVKVIPYNPATSDGLRQYAPALAKQFELSATRNSGDWTERLATSFEKVLFDMEQRGDYAKAIIDWGQWDYAVYERLLLQLAKEDYIPNNYDGIPSEWVGLRQTEYSNVFQQTTQSISWYDDDADFVVDGDEEEERRSWTCRVRR